jgi:hypothetical protein
VTYLDIIEQCMEFRSLIKAQQKNLLKRVVHPLNSSIEQKFKDAETRFRAHRKTVEREAELCHMIEAAESRALVLRDKQLQELNNKGKLFTSWFMWERRLIVCSPSQEETPWASIRN